MRQQFADKGNPDGVVAHAQPFAGRAVFYLNSDGIDGHHEDKQHQYTRCKGVAQIYGVVQPRVIEWMRIYDDGLEEGHRLLLGSAFGIEGGAGGGSRCQFAHHLHIFEEQ